MCIKSMYQYLLFLIILGCWKNTSAQFYDIYISDVGNFNLGPWQILKFDSNGENPETFIDDHLAWPQDILFFEQEEIVLISNFNTGTIATFNSESGEYLGDFASGIGGSTRMKIGTDSLLYILQWDGNGKVKRFELDGTYVDDFTEVGVPQSIGIDWDSEGNLYVSSYTQDYVRKFDSAGNDLGLFISTDLAGPTNIWFDQSGDLLVSDYDGAAIKRFNSSGIFQGNFITGVGQTEGVAFLENGNILIGNGGTSSVKQFDSDGNYINDLITSGAGGLTNPNAVVLRYYDTPSALPTVTSPSLELIHPTIGRGSSFNLITHPEIDFYELVSIDGRKTFTIQANKAAAWHAEGLHSGQYLLVAHLHDDTTVSQHFVIME